MTESLASRGCLGKVRAEGNRRFMVGMGVCQGQSGPVDSSCGGAGEGGGGRPGGEACWRRLGRHLPLPGVCWWQRGRATSWATGGRPAPATAASGGRPRAGRSRRNLCGARGHPIIPNYSSPVGSRPPVAAAPAPCALATGDSDGTIYRPA